MIQLPRSFTPSHGRGTPAQSHVLRRTWPFVLDLCVAGLLLACFYGVLVLGRYWVGHAQPQIVISQSPRALPLYAFYSIVRIGLAYLLSLFFAVGYGYVAANNKRVEALMIALLDILQSIPVLSFLPPVMLAMVALFPSRQLGLEMGAILLIFTGQVWNMAFSFYSSIKSIPRELREAADISRFSRLQRLLELELPYAAIGLIWNSIMSVAGGWFFLMACEMQQGTHDLRLPGLGSFLQTAAGTGNGAAIAWGLAAMIAIIVATDQMVWRPMIAWSDKFKFEQVESAARVRSPLLHLLRQSNAVRSLMRHTGAGFTDGIYHWLAEKRRARLAEAAASPIRTEDLDTWISSRLRVVLMVAIGGAVLYAAGHALLLVREVRGPEFMLLLKGAAVTFLRVNFSLLLAAAWTIPVGVAIGFNPRLAKLAQPLAQIAASVRLHPLSLARYIAASAFLISVSPSKPCSGNKLIPILQLILKRWPSLAKSTVIPFNIRSAITVASFTLSRPHKAIRNLSPPTRATVS